MDEEVRKATHLEERLEVLRLTHLIVDLAKQSCTQREYVSTGTVEEDEGQRDAPRTSISPNPRVDFLPFLRCFSLIRASVRSGRTIETVLSNSSLSVGLIPPSP